MLLGYTVTRACASPRKLTWFTRPIFLVRGWGLGTRLNNGITKYKCMHIHHSFLAPFASCFLFFLLAPLHVPVNYSNNPVNPTISYRCTDMQASLVPIASSVRGEKWPGINCLHMHNHSQKYDLHSEIITNIYIHVFYIVRWTSCRVYTIARR